MDAQDCLLACYRYIELNPVRARMVEGPELHPWSSYPFNALCRADAAKGVRFIFCANGLRHIFPACS